MAEQQNAVALTHAWFVNARDIAPVSEARYEAELEMRRAIGSRPSGVGMSAVMSGFILAHPVMRSDSGHTAATRRFNAKRDAGLIIVELPVVK